MPQVAFAVGAVGGPMMGLALIAKERRHAGISLDDDVAAAPAIATLGLAFRPPFGPLVGDHPGAAVAGPEMHFYLIDEHENSSPISETDPGVGLSRERR